MPNKRDEQSERCQPQRVSLFRTKVNVFGFDSGMWTLTSKGEVNLGHAYSETERR